MSDPYERRVLDTTFDVRNAPNGQKVIEGYAAKFDRYSENLGGFVEVLHPGAFKRAINDERIKGKYEHELTLARTGAGTLRISEDATGLPYEIDINTRDSEAMNVLARVERGDVAHSSFAFTVAKNGDLWAETDQGFPLREINSVGRLYDVSVVSDPAYEDTNAQTRALRSFARSLDLDVAAVTHAADEDELIDLIRRSHIIPEADGEVVAPVSEPTNQPQTSAAAASAVGIRAEMERQAARIRARQRLHH